MINVLKVDDNAKTAEGIFVAFCGCLLHFTPLFPSFIEPYPSFVPRLI